mmetsp:Transcript_78021/g.137484  ORF Transcript_78021/g.137484 Transcript_78021/m.137484 type:complete len:174 (+) Transcript_78021:111-632(+)|eukprot:CAMPEP_0197629104 /NCGR_PEP_ID=MMETSP1338-20131121/7105_1 /TAXON_ID=43686 ORGANISM="Pelagodinium beii, Strain RCC1491" /NCGR_SAMPLE_ID=MMETSP1338 /ASSEMBLY_ACC=CAM_ASM_000754 /LENGTH=173 /DNA_ID=CAMNT_0043200115 /DNA_START=109 /DNA_END=630 /DNA_ORIENTATION=-
MPKVLWQHFTNRNVKEDDNFNVFSCKRCKACLVITDADLHNIPRRKTDGAVVLDARQQCVKLSTEKREGSKLIRREKGAERQYIHACPKCDHDVGYTSKPYEDPESLQIIFLLEAAVDIPWHKAKTPWVCKVCNYVCQSEAHLEQHRKQRQHSVDMEESMRNRDELRPIVTGA